MPARPFRLPPPETEDQRIWRWVLWAAFAMTVARLAWIALDLTDLYPDEAQYWVWAQNPDWGYYSKPPMVAWIIALTTKLFGDSGPAVRVAAPILHFATALILFRAARLLYDARTAAWAAIAYITLPGVSFSAAIMSTDAPLLLFWTVALYGLLRARESGDRRWWLLVGGAIGFGLLSKFAMAYWVLCALCYFIAVPEARRQWPYLVGAMALGLAIYSPNFLWNYAHAFSSYHHTEANASLGGTLFHPRQLLNFFGAQFGVFGPLFFGALILLIALARRTLNDARAALLICFTLPPLVLMLGLSLLSRAEANWAAPSYIAATILTIAWLRAIGWQVIVSVSVGLHLVAALVVGVGVRNIAAVAGIELPMKYDPLHRVEGWRRLGRAISTQLLQHPGAILMADDRELLAALMFYVEPHPFNALKWNGEGGIHDNFDLTAQPKLYIGGNFLLVARHEDDLERIFSRFNEVSPPQTITIFLGLPGTVSRPDEQRRYVVYFLKGFKGYQ